MFIYIYIHICIMQVNAYVHATLNAEPNRERRGIAASLLNDPLSLPRIVCLNNCHVAADIILKRWPGPTLASCQVGEHPDVWMDVILRKTSAGWHAKEAAWT